MKTDGSVQMQKILGYVRKAVEQYEMIQDGDHIAVAVSGGKDSLVMLAALSEYRRFSGKHYTLTAITVDPRFGGQPTDYSSVQSLCDKLDVPYVTEPTDIAEIVFSVRKEPNPCSLCARMRRGALHELCQKLKCNKLALGHNNDDVIETFFMNLFKEGRIGCFAPVNYLDRRGLTVIRPLCLAPERKVISAANRCEIQTVRSSCPADKHTYRQDIKEWLDNAERNDKGFKDRVFGALQRSDVDGWGISHKENNSSE